MKPTAAQRAIFIRDRRVESYDGSDLYPIYGSGEHRSCGSLENKGYGKIVSSSHNGNQYMNCSFFRFVDGYSFNYVTGEVTK